MGGSLPPLTLPEFRDQLAASTGLDLDAGVCAALHHHYTELRRWSPRLSLIGPGTVHQVLGRHYGESLAALALLRTSDRRLVDLGSGAGFPGLVIAAARPALEVTLVEARARKCAFLQSSLRRGGLSCRCLNARVGRSVPEGFPTEIDVLTSRAVAIDPALFEALREESPRLRLLLWQGRSRAALPPGWTVSRELPLGESEHRRILEIRFVRSVHRQVISR